MAIIINIHAMDNDEDTVTVSRVKYDTIMNENEIMQNEIARLQNLLKSRKRFREVLPTQSAQLGGEDKPTDEPSEECEPEHEKKHEHDNTTMARTKNRRLVSFNRNPFVTKTNGRKRRLEEEELTPRQTKIKMYTCMVVITAIIAISIGFEIGRDMLEESTKEALKPILRNVFGEMTILGFIGLIMFFTTKFGKDSLNHLVGNNATGWFKKECFYVDCELVCPENPLVEETETVHMILFLVMMIFLSSIVLLIRIGTNKVKRWRYLEDVALTTDLLDLKHKCLQEFQKYTEAGFCEKLRLRSKLHNADEILRYAALRTGFIITANANVPVGSEHSLTADYDFAEYVGHELNDVLIEMAEIKPGNWFYLWVVFMGFLCIDLIDLASGEKSMLLVYSTIGGAYASCFVLAMIRNKMESIERALIHHDHLLDEHEPHKTLIVNSSGNNGDVEESKSQYQPLLSDVDDVMAHKRDMTELDHHPPYKFWPDGSEKPKPRATCTCLKWCKSGDGKKKTEEEEEEEGYHALLFWGGEEGVEYLQAYLRCQMVLCAIYMGCFTLALFDGLNKYWTEEDPDTSVPVILTCLIAFIPIPVHVYEMEHILPNLAMVTSIEEMINNKGILRTIRLMKSKNAMQALHNISCFMHGVDRLASESKQKALEVQIFTKLSAKQKEALMNDAVVKKFRNRENILTQGQTNSYLYIITDGTCDVVVGGKKVAEMKQGREFGEISLLGKTHCKATVQAQGSVVCLLLDLAAYKKHLEGRGGKSAAKRRQSMINFEKAKENNEAKQMTLSGIAENDEQEEGEETHVASNDVKHVVKHQSHIHDKKEEKRTKKKSVFHESHKGRLPKALKYYRRVALSKIFQCIDSDGGGEVDQEELEAFLGKLFPSEGKDSEMYEKQLKMMIEGLDEDGDGTVTEEEFLTMMVPIVEKEEENESMEDVAKRMFEILDDDHSGAVTTSEFKETLEKMGVFMSYEEVRELFHEYDDDLDGLMDEEEFVNMMTHQL
jgi:Ca2+-binding EF-hand superfamily protein